MISEVPCSEGNQAWKLNPLRLLSGVGGTLLFQCKYDIKYLNLSADLLALNFYKDMISHKQELNNVVPTTKKGVRDQIVWKNRFIKINKASAYFRSWHQAGISKLSSLLDESNTRFLSFNESLRKFKVKCIFFYSTTAFFQQCRECLEKISKPGRTGCHSYFTCR